ncbi:MAG: AAA family ATPase [Bacteroidales bacterium]
MLLRVTIKNFLSFYNETVFDMFPNTKRERFTNHIYKDNKIPLLKQAAIYGANGSGKSNFIKAIWFIHSFVTNRNFIKGLNLEEYRFQLADNNIEPIYLGIEFECEDQYFIYQIEIGDTVIERLYYSGLGEKEDTLIFERNGSDIFSDKPLQNESSAIELIKLNSFSSILALDKEFPVLSNTIVSNVTKWFNNNLEIVTIDATIPMLIDIMSSNESLLDFTNTIFERIGIGIKSIDISNTPFEEWAIDENNAATLKQIINSEITELSAISQLQNRRNVRSISMKSGKKVVQEFVFNQLGQGGCEKQMKISAQSDGTVRLLTLIPAIYAAVKKGKVVLIDEIDNSIHPNLVFALLKFFAGSNTNGQLIFTTHTPKLLNQQELMRIDEVWITDKINGSTQMRSLNDFKIHNTINIENGYLDGRYGGVPILKEIEENDL